MRPRDHGGIHLDGNLGPGAAFMTFDHRKGLDDVAESARILDVGRRDTRNAFVVDIS